jgi:hypothetical protein
MKWPTLIGACAFALFLHMHAVVKCRDHQPQQLERFPLDQVWGYMMPGTRDVRELEPKRDIGLLSPEEFIKASQVQQIRLTLSSRGRAKEGEQAGPAIMVKGTGKEALKNASIALANKGKVAELDSARTFPADSDLSILFFAYLSPRYVRIVSVNRSMHQLRDGQVETNLTIEYQLVSHISANMTPHFALIPLGKLNPGVVRVKIQQLPPVDEFGKEDKPLRNVRRYVCESTSFIIQ